MQRIYFLFLVFLLNQKVQSQERLIGNLAYGFDPFSKGVTYTINTDGSGFSPQKEFEFSFGQGLDIIDGQDGFFYGISNGGGFSYSNCVVFKVNYSGTNYTVLHKFSGATDGAAPRYRPALHADGFLYGVCELGGTYGNGTIWKVHKNGTGFSVLKHFNKTGESIYGSFGSITIGVDGKLYGLASGGTNDAGVIFSLNTNAPYQFTVNANFTTASTGKYPRATLYQASDGNFYGICNAGGANGLGTIFQFTYPSLSLNTIYTFDGVNGSYPTSTLIEGPGGLLFGTCLSGGQFNQGCLFNCNKVTREVASKGFTSATGNGASRQLYAHSDGNIYFFTAGGAAESQGAFISFNGASFNVLRTNFMKGATVNSFSFVPGTSQVFACASAGGYRQQGISNSGMIFKMDINGTNFSICHQFDMHALGSNPIGKPLYIANSNAHFNKVFGVCNDEGIYDGGSVYTMYPEDPQSFKVLHFFTVEEGRGSSSLIMGKDGNMYACMQNAGSAGGVSFSGLLYRINPETGAFTLIKGFTADQTTLLNPVGTLLEASDGYLYGTARTGGSGNLGGVFRIKKDGTNYEVLKHFSASDGNYATGGLVQDTATGIIYGTTVYGGTNNGGIIFSINPATSIFTLLYSFAASTNPNEGLIIRNDTLYGTTAYGGSANMGMLYKIVNNGTGFTVLKNFDHTTGGAPKGYLAQSRDGFFYGATVYSNIYTGGTLYKMRPDGSGFSVIKTFSSTNAAYPGPPALAYCGMAPYPNASQIFFGLASQNTVLIKRWTTPASNTQGYVIKINTINRFSPLEEGANPVANTNYSGTGEQVVYNGNLVQPFMVRNLQPGTMYYFKIFAFGGCSGRLYNNDPAEGNPDSIRTRLPGINPYGNLMAVFDGVNDYVQMGDVDALENQSAISIGGWIKPLAFPQINGQIIEIVSKGDEITGTGSMLNMRFSKSDGLNKFEVSLGISNNIYYLNTDIDSNLFRIAQWSHVFLTWHNGGKMCLYINGRKIAESFENINGVTNNVVLPLTLGWASNGFNNAGFFHGNMEEWQFYNIELSECEIRQRKHLTLTGSEIGLLAYYQFNEPNNTAFLDVVSGYNGQKINGATATTSDLSTGPGRSDCSFFGSTDYSYLFSASDFSNNLQMNFPGVSPNGNMTINYLETTPVGGNPAFNLLPGYWIIDNFGTNTQGLMAQLTFQLPHGSLTDLDRSHYTLYKRPSNGTGSWTAFPITGLYISDSINAITINNIPSFSQIVLTNTNMPLPVQLVAFNGNIEKNNALLNWVVDNEEQIVAYVLQRKYNNTNAFEDIKMLNAINIGSHQYTFTDFALPEGTVWYRLKIIDKNGSIKYSNVINFKILSNFLSIYPNPVRHFLSIKGIDPNTTARIVIYSVSGVPVITSTIARMKNDIDIQSLIPGNYVVQVYSNGNVWISQFIKQ